MTITQIPVQRFSERRQQSEFRWHQGFEHSGTMGSSSSRRKRSLHNQVFSTVEHRARLPTAQLHDLALGDTSAPVVPSRGAPKIMDQHPVQPRAFGRTPPRGAHRADAEWRPARALSAPGFRGRPGDYSRLLI